MQMVYHNHKSKWNRAHTVRNMTQMNENIISEQLYKLNVKTKKKRVRLRQESKKEKKLRKHENRKLFIFECINTNEQHGND